ncbi:MAG TPA: SDR family oxidoreductase [Spirochaetota bacterium]|nr:SDR family oxidoreductase [Spirochaetota bacterium]HPL17875.1 SDR family oxidoreductase [Spirochaetota bacterium]HQF09407.1 SDR family oxidoreductase [Spirochaetota bacterium]HQH97979.1 SDR family oxidoreductase [Spirochaetota bacterium]HQJ71130.1 SDR family oxidoreductase [Spirochaetota bacterium]
MDKKWVLITGASTGIGRACAELIASEGFGVYACARKKTDLDSLGGVSGIVPLKLDVTNAEDCGAALSFIRKRKTGLYGLVNNAGIAVAGPLIDISDSDMDRQFEVNLLGVHRVTRTFLPLLMESSGRIVMMSSDSGFFATPFVGPYCASKFALEGYSDSLRRELLLCGVKVVIIQPGRIATPIWDKTEKILEMKGTSPFIELARKIGIEAVGKGRTTGLPPEAIARVVQGALTTKRPRLRYLVAASTLKYRIVKLLPASKVDAMVKKELLRH